MWPSECFKHSHCSVCGPVSACGKVLAFAVVKFWTSGFCIKTFAYWWTGQVSLLFYCHMRLYIWFHFIIDWPFHSQENLFYLHVHFYIYSFSNKIKILIKSSGMKLINFLSSSSWLYLRLSTSYCLCLPGTNQYVFFKVSITHKNPEVTFAISKFTPGLTWSLIFPDDFWTPVRDLIICYKTGKRFSWPSVFWLYFIIPHITFLFTLIDLDLTGRMTDLLKYRNQKK